MALKYGSTTITVLKYGANNITTGKYGSTTVFSSTPKMQDQITGIQSYISGQYWYVKWKCVSGFTASYTVTFNGTLYNISGVSTSVNTSGTYTGATTEKTFTARCTGGVNARNLSNGSIKFSCPGYTDYTYSTSPKADLSNYITIVQEGDYGNYYYIQFKKNTTLSGAYDVETDITVYDTERQTTYYQDQYSYPDASTNELDFWVDSGFDLLWVTGTITFSKEYFNDYVYDVDYPQ